jgi:hypothetical protein
VFQHVVNQTRLLVLTAALLLTAWPAAAGMKLRFEERAIVVSGVTPGARTMWLAVIHEPHGYHPRITDRSSVVADDDRDGVVRLTMDQGVRNDSVWVVVDMMSGDHVVETPSPARVKHVSLSPGLLHRKGNGKGASIENVSQWMVFWCVRPGVGVWKSIVDDGSATDADGIVDGKLTSALSSMVSVDSNQIPPDDFQRGDVLVAVDLFGLDTYDMRVVQ